MERLPKFSLKQIFIVSAVVITMAAAFLIYFHSFRYVRYQGINYLSYNELVSLSKNPDSFWPKRKANKLFSTPIISNEAYYQGKRPRKLVDPKLGPMIRLAEWNIEKSIATKEAVAAFTNEEEYKKLIDTKKYPEGSEEYKTMLAQRARLAAADIVVLEEMDIGVKRSGYVNAPAELAKAMGMNYAYGAAYLEIDPVNLGMKEEFTYEDGKVDEKLYEVFKVDRNKYKGLFGTAVLSRYPIKHVEVFPLNVQPYDWYAEEKKKTSYLEKVKREASKDIFLERIMREMKVGGRNFMRVDLAVPGLPENTLTLIAIHLEIKCQPSGREAQMIEILNYIHKIKHPVIMTGDFNSAPDDISPTSVKREIRRAATDPTFWFSTGISILVPYGFFINVGKFVTNFTKNVQDPTAANIPLLLPNKQKGMFSAIENYRFDDGNAFDFRGDKNRSTNEKDGTLANSNERDGWGFRMSFTVERTIFHIAGKYRLDWVFVKPWDLKNSKDEKGSYRFAPHFGTTMEQMNYHLKQNISDHAPNVVDLPLEEPKIPHAA